MPPSDEMKPDSAPATGQGHLLGGGVGVVSAEALIHNAKYLPHPYDQYLVGAAPIVAAVSTVLLPRLLATLRALLTIVVEYCVERADVWKANRTINKAKTLLKGKGLSDEDRKYCEDAIKLHRRVIVESYVPMPKSRAKAQQV